MEYWEWIYVLPKDRISDQKSIGLRLRIVVSLQASKPGYRGGLGNKLLSCLQCVHSSEQSSPASKAFKAFTTGLSYWSLCQMRSMKAASSPSNVTSSVALTSNTSGLTTVHSPLSSPPFTCS